MSNALRLSSMHIPAAAKSVARRSALIAIPTLLFGAFLMLLVVLHFIAVASGIHSSPAPVTLALPFVAIASGGLGIRSLVTQRRATLAAVKANADPKTLWYLDGFVVIPYVRGVPDRTLSFKVPPAMRVKLAQAGRYVAVG